MSQESPKYWSEGNGRFRPVYWVGYAMESTWAGTDSRIWHADRIILAVVALSAIYWALSAVLPVMSCVVLSLIPFCGPQVETWIRLGPAEAYAFPLAVTGVAALFRATLAGRGPWRVWPAFLLLEVAALAKENFLVLLVVVLGLSVVVRWWLGVGWSRRDWLVLAAAATVSAINGAAIVWTLSAQGVQYPQARTLGSALNWLGFWFGATNDYMLTGLAFVAFPLLVLAARRRHVPVKWTLVVGGCCMAVLLTQLVFYAGASQQGRYLYPMLLVVDAFWAVDLLCALSVVKSLTRNQVWVSALAALVFTLPIVGGARSAWNIAAYNRDVAVEFQNNLLSVEREVRRSGVKTVVLQPGFPDTDTERVLSLARYLEVSTGVVVMTAPAVDPGRTDLSRHLSRVLSTWSRHGYDSLTPFKPTVDCLSVVFGNQRPLCRAVVMSPG